MFYISLVKAAMEKGHRTVSSIPKPVNYGTAEVVSVAGWYNGTTQQSERLSTLMNPASGIQGAALHGSTVVLMSGLTTSHVGAVNDEAVIYGLGDSFELHPHYSTKANISKFVVSCVSHGTANALSLTRLPQDLATLPAAAGQPAGGMERFNFPGYDATDPESFPVMVYMNLVANLPYDHKAPTSDNLTSLALEQEQYEKDTYLDAYLTSMKWLLEQNGGDSLHHSSNFFDHTTLQHAVAPAAQNLADTCNFSTYLVQHPSVPGNGSEVVSERIKQTIATAINIAGIGEQARTVATQPAQSVIQTTTQTESQQNARNTKNMLQWQLTLVGKDNAGAVVLPTLSQPLKDAYMEKSPTHAATHFTRALGDYLQGTCADLLGTRGGTCSLNPEEIYPYMARVILEAETCTSNLRINPQHVTKELSLFCFSKSNPKNHEYTEVVTGGQKAMSAVAMAPHNNTIPLSASTLYVQGECTRLDHALHVLSNFEAFLKFLLEDPRTHNSYVCEYLATVYDLIGSMTNRRNIEPITDGQHGNKFFVANFLLDVHMGIARICQFSCDATVRRLAIDNQDLGPEFDKMKKDVDSVLQNMKYNFTAGKFNEWEAYPRVLGFIKPDLAKNPGNGGGGKHPIGNGNGQPETPTGKKPKGKKGDTPQSAGSKNSNSGNVNTIHGVIKPKDGITKLPEIPLTIKGQNVSKGNALTTLCRVNVVEGKVCKNEKCPYAHFAAKNFHTRVPDLEHQKQFCDFVNNSAEFEWTGRALTPRGS